MRNSIAISIFIVGFAFLALFGWVHRYVYIPGGETAHAEVPLTVRVNVFTNTTCAMVPPFVVFGRLTLEESDEETDWCR